MSWAPLAQAAEKVTYEDNVLPIFRNNCLKCHNPNDNKGSLDLTTFSGVMKGGGSGASVVSGDADSSKLIKSVTHAEDPAMPPNSPMIPDKDIDLIKRWIAGGLLETSGSKAIAASKPKMDLALAGPIIGKPEGPLPMPADLLLEPAVRTTRTSASTGMAANPWSPLVALGGQKQVLLYNTDTLELAGVLPFPEGFPVDLRFTRNGKFLLAGGGYGAKLGLVVLWDVTTGERIATMGDEFDTVLAADISGDQKWIALGGPSRLVKIYSTEDGKPKHIIKKHTDWVTALEFSPNSKLLATGDRAGGIHVWETSSGDALYELKGHKGAITALSWRTDSEILASASEDATIKLWKVKDEQAVKSWTAHRDGTLWASCALDGRIVSCGRDNQFDLWDANGNRKVAIHDTNDIPVRVALTADGKRIIGSDWVGNVFVWDALKGGKVGTLSLNPPTLAQRLADAADQRQKCQSLAEQAQAALLLAQADVVKAEGGQTNDRIVEAAKKKVAEVQAEIEKRKSELVAVEARIAELKAAQFNVTVYQARDELAARQKENAKLVAAVSDAKSAVDEATAALAKARKTAGILSDTVEGLKNVLRFDKRHADETASGLKKAARAATKIEGRATRAAAEAAKARADVSRAPDNSKLAEALREKQRMAEHLQREWEPLKKALAEKQAEADRKAKELEATRADLAKTQKEAEDLARQLKPLAQKVRQAEADAVGAKLAAEKSTQELEQHKARVDELMAEYRRLKPAGADARKSARL